MVFCISLDLLPVGRQIDRSIYTKPRHIFVHACILTCTHKIHQSVASKQNPMGNKAHRLRFSMGSSGVKLHALVQSQALDRSLTRVVSRISRAGAGSFELVMFEDYQG